MKKFKIFIIAIVILITGCGNSASNELKTIPSFSDNSYIPIPRAKGIEDYEELDWMKAATKLDNEYQNAVKQICEDLCTYLNTEYGAGWEVEDIEAYSTNVQENLSGLGACYYKGKIYIDPEFLSNGLNDQFTYIIAHELIHFMYEKNVGVRFFTYDLGNCRYGEYMSEAFTDILAIKYAKYKNPDAELIGGYETERVYIDALSISIPDIYKYFFENDIEGFSKDFINHSEKYVVCEGAVFLKFLSMIDDTRYSDDPELRGNIASVMISFIASITSYEDREKFAKAIESICETPQMFEMIMYR